MGLHQFHGGGVGGHHGLGFDGLGPAPLDRPHLAQPGRAAAGQQLLGLGPAEDVDDPSDLTIDALAPPAEADHLPADGLQRQRAEVCRRCPPVQVFEGAERGTHRVDLRRGRAVRPAVMHLGVPPERGDDFRHGQAVVVGRGHPPPGGKPLGDPAVVSLAGGGGAESAEVDESPFDPDVGPAAGTVLFELGDADGGGGHGGAPIIRRVSWHTVRIKTLAAPTRGVTLNHCVPVTYEVGDTGLEPVTSCVSCKRASQLRQSPAKPPKRRTPS